jgi:multidrug resistance protein MdtO
MTNPEYAIAVKERAGALITALLFVGPTIRAFTPRWSPVVVSLSTIGSSNQKGLLRFGGAAVGGLMGLVALVYAFPNVEGLGGFWPLLPPVPPWPPGSMGPAHPYGGYQTGHGLHHKAHCGTRPAMSATVVRDRLIGVARVAGVRRGGAPPAGPGGGSMHAPGRRLPLASLARIAPTRTTRMRTS